MKIGSLVIENNTVLAPVAGITNLPFRLMVKRAGCGLVCSEMISANGIIFGSRKTISMLDSFPEEKPVSFQIFGSEPSIMADAAVIVESRGADIIDINFGCSVKKVVKTGAGVALMKEKRRAEDVLKAVRKCRKDPPYHKNQNRLGKIRRGCSHNSRNRRRLRSGCGCRASEDGRPGFQGRCRLVCHIES